MLATTSFDLWMSKGTYDIFALVINFMDENLQPKKVTIDLFETTKTCVLSRNLKKFLDSYGLRKKIILYVKDEGITTKDILVCQMISLDFE
jgi:hypothetical protein